MGVQEAVGAYGMTVWRPALRAMLMTNFRLKLELLVWPQGDADGVGEGSIFSRSQLSCSNPGAA